MVPWLGIRSNAFESNFSDAHSPAVRGPGRWGDSDGIHDWKKALLLYSLNSISVLAFDSVPDSFLCSALSFSFFPDAG
jgi:hypothetical protein